MKIKENIIGERIYLRTLEEPDASQEYCDWLNDKEVNIYLQTRKSTIEELKAYIDKKNKQIDCIFLGIYIKENDKHVGNLKLEPIDKDNAHFSIMIGDKDYWGKGIGTEATRLITDFGFEKLNLESIDLDVISENVRAIKTYEKVGFKTYKTVPNSLINDGVAYDQVFMKIRKGELN